MPYQFDVDKHKRLLGRVNLPEKVKCKDCKKIRLQSAFSKRQLEMVRSGIAYGHTNGITGEISARCRQCTGGQTVELTCSVCDRTKPLEYFSKVQRRDPDNARCTNCVQGHLDAEPISEENKNMIENESHLESTTYKSQTGDAALNIESLRTLAITGGTEPDHASFDIENPYARGDLANRNKSQVSSALSSNPDAKNDDKSTIAGADDTKGDWCELQPNRNRSNNNKGDGIPFTAYDPNGVPHARTASGAPSVAGSVASGASGRTGWEGWNVSRSTRGPEIAAMVQQKHQQEQRSKGRNPGFAKIPGGKVPKDQAPSQRLEEPVGPVLDPEDSEDSDDGDITKWI